MTNKEDLMFGNLYVMNISGSCDNCGSPQRLDNVIAIYRGEYPSGDLFEIAPFCCPGCHKVVDRYNFQKPINVTKEINKIVE